MPASGIPVSLSDGYGHVSEASDCVKTPLVVTFVPPFISFCGAFHSFYGVMKEAPEPDSEKAAKESAAEPESSPDSPLVQNEPPHEDEEQPVVLTRG